MGDDVLLGRMGPELELLLPMLDERSRRLVLGAVARAAGEGGRGAVASLTGASWQTVADGAAEVVSGGSAPPGRVRRPGAGRRPLAVSDPGLLPALEALVRDSMRGDPQSPLTWTTRSVKKLAGELAAAGHPCSPVTVWRTLRSAGYTLQSNSKAAEGRQHPERDAQFRYIAAQAQEHMAAGQPVISVDAKKREKTGDYGQDGREWRPKGDPLAVRSHDFPDKDGRHAVPYGVYDQAANAGFVNVGTDGNTAALAVESVRRWWQLAGKDAYPGAGRLLVTCDAGGSNGYRNRAWKAGLAALARETGLDVTVCHFPPGTSKWNKIEHRLFSQITLAWRGRPLTSYDVIIDTIGHVATRTGLTCAAVLDENDYPTGLKVTDQEMKQVEDRQLTRHEFHGEWNYTLLAAPRPAAPAPDPPPPAPARLLPAAALNQAALTGASPQAVTALAAALAGRLDARLHHDIRVRRGPRANPASRAGSPRRLATADYLLAALLKRHLGVPSHVTAALLGVHQATVRHAVRLITAILRDAGTTLPPPERPPPEQRIRTLSGLREHAAGHGIAIPVPPEADTPPPATLTTRDTPRNHLISKRSHIATCVTQSCYLRVEPAGKCGQNGASRRALRRFPSDDPRSRHPDH
jgi:Rhodopirellula transposase DDE domain